MAGMATGKDMANSGPNNGLLSRASVFFRQVRQEFDKITWPTRKETTVTTAMVFVMVVIAAIFFLIGDFLIGAGIDLVLGLGR
jgi:preprotein translocase subunit SecE